MGIHWERADNILGQRWERLGNVFGVDTMYRRFVSLTTIRNPTVKPYSDHRPWGAVSMVAWCFLAGSSTFPHHSLADSWQRRAPHMYTTVPNSFSCIFSVPTVYTAEPTWFFPHLFSVHMCTPQCPLGFSHTFSVPTRVPT